MVWNGMIAKERPVCGRWGGSKAEALIRRRVRLHTPNIRHVYLSMVDGERCLSLLFVLISLVLLAKLAP